MWISVKHGSTRCLGIKFEKLMNSMLIHHDLLEKISLFEIPLRDRIGSFCSRTLQPQLLPLLQSSNLLLTRVCQLAELINGLAHAWQCFLLVGTD